MTKAELKALGEDKAGRVKTFIEQLEHTQGEYAGRAFELLPWQWNEVIRPLFSTLKPDGLRQYRFCYVEIPKKNGKSPLAAAIGLYMLCADHEAAPEVYIAAADREQAGYVYRYAEGYVSRNATLSRRLKVLDSRKRIVNHRNRGFLQVLSAEAYTKHGINPSCVIFDELHTQPNDDLWNTLISGTHYARQQQVVFAMSTAGIWDKTSIWWRIREKARQIRDGIVEQQNFLPVLYIADPEKDDPGDEELWKRVNPSLGHIFTVDKVREDYNEARNDPVELQNFKRFRCNIPVKQVSRWMPMDAWDRCGGRVHLEGLEGKVCYGGLDMSTKIDLTAFVLVFPPQDSLAHYVIVPRFYVPEATIIKRSRQDAVHYEVWEEQGYITATPGDVIDEEFILKDVVEASQAHAIQEIGFDPWGATSLSNKLFNLHGIVMVEVRQGAKSLSEPAKDVLVKVKQGTLRHGGHPVLRWCADNLVMVLDANENVRPDKEKATERIDGMVALFNAWNRIINQADTGPSVYEEQGLMIV